MKDVRLQVITETFRPDVVNGRPTPPEERDKAYMVWAWECGRNFTRAAELLGVDRSTIMNWSRSDNWALRYEQEIADTSPQSQRLLALTHLGNNAYRAATVATELMGHTTEEYADLIMQHIDASGWDTVEHRHDLEAALRHVLAGNDRWAKVRLSAAQDLLNRCGVSADAGIRMTPYSVQPVEPVQDLTDEELFDSI